MVASVLTNNAAMIALQTLRNTNSDLETINNQISTGKRVATARDNAAVFAISTVMESDVSGFEAIESSLRLGNSTLGVAAAASNEIGGLLEEIKGRLISSTDQNVDRQQLGDEIASLTNQITSVVNAAQFNGLNLLDGSAGAAFTVISSLDRSGTTVTQRSIQVAAADTDLSQSTATAVLAFDTDTSDAGEARFTAGTPSGDDTANVSDFVTTVADAGNADIVLAEATLAAGDVVTIEIDGRSFSATATGPATQDVASVLADQINAAGLTGITATVTFNDAAAAAPTVLEDVLNIANASGGAVTITGAARSGSAGGLANLGDGTTGAGGGLAAAAVGGATQADLNTVETLIQNVTGVQAALGTAMNRVEIQQTFMSNLIDSFKTGIGALVDADLEEASARLQALQVQQQLGIQSLSIANQAPQNILALFR